MSAIDLSALVDSLSDSTAGNIGDVIANFSTEMLQKASEAIAAQYINTENPLNSVGGGVIWNHTLELHCIQQQQQQQQILDKTAINATATKAEFRYPPDSFMASLAHGCPISFDSVLCWPKTPPGTWAVLPCFEEFKGVHYDPTQNATRFCFPNGTWHSYSNYDKCHHSPPLPVPDFAPNIELPAYIYCCGYFVSFTALILALIVFLCFKDLKCLRNTIHANLFLTYILSALLWILTLFLQVITDSSSQAGCITLVMIFHYFNLTNFFWMFVEGLYLYTLVVQTFSSDNIKFLMYAFIGWGCPAIIIFMWSIAKIYATPLESEHFNGLDIECSWMRESHIDWIFQGPASLALLLNLIFLIRIMWVLITKLRSANTLETRQYHKASKALLVLIPLFGITYLLVLTGPNEGLSRNLFEIIRAFLISTQGFFVSLFFCFLNSEVRQTLHHRFERWRDNRNLRRGNSQRNRRYRLSKDYSQRSRTESLRLTSTTSPVSIGHNE